MEVVADIDCGVMVVGTACWKPITVIDYGIQGIALSIPYRKYITHATLMSLTWSWHKRFNAFTVFSSQTNSSSVLARRTLDHETKSPRQITTHSLTYPAGPNPVLYPTVYSKNGEESVLRIPDNNSLCIHSASPRARQERMCVAALNLLEGGSGDISPCAMTVT